MMELKGGTSSSRHRPGRGDGRLGEARYCAQYYSKSQTRRRAMTSDSRRTHWPASGNATRSRTRDFRFQRRAPLPPTSDCHRWAAGARGQFTGKLPVATIGGRTRLLPSMRLRRSLRLPVACTSRRRPRPRHVAPELATHLTNLTRPGSPGIWSRIRPFESSFKSQVR